MFHLYNACIVPSISSLFPLMKLLFLQHLLNSYQRQVLVLQVLQRFLSLKNSAVALADLWTTFLKQFLHLLAMFL